MKSDNVSALFGLFPAQLDLLRQNAATRIEGRVAQLIYRITGPLDEGHLAGCWQTVVARHPALRSSVHWQGMEKPVQAIWSRVETPITRLDWRKIAAFDRERKLQEFCAGERNARFDEKHAPLHRTALVKFGLQEHILVFTSSELALDAFSARRVIQELLAFYAGMDGTLNKQPEFKEYVDKLRRQDPNSAAGFWRGLLEDLPEPALIAHRSFRNHDPQDFQDSLAEDAVINLTGLAQKFSCDLESVLLGAWALLLCRQSRQDSLMFGVELLRGKTSAADAVIGRVSHVVPFRVELQPQARLQEWLRGIFNRKAEVNQFSSCSLDSIAQWIELGPGEPLFTTCVFLAESAPLAVQTDGGPIGAELLQSHSSCSAEVELKLELGPEIMVRVEGTRDNRNLVRQYMALLKDLSAGRDACLSEIGVLAQTTKSSSGEMLATRDETPGKLIHELFKDSAAKYSGLTAVHFEDQELSYLQLELQSNKLAHHLQSTGVGPEVMVGVLMPRCLETAVALLGILKAGGVYVPLDPDYPSDRISALVEDSRLAVLITKDRCLTDLPLVATATELISLDGDWSQILSQSESAPFSGVLPDNLAYVIYTSGSTGTPNGVAVSHRAAASHLEAISAAFGYTTADTAMLFASISFDVSLEQLLAPLLAGSTVVIKGEEVLSSREFRHVLKDYAITVANTPPAFWRELMEEGCDDREAFSGLRQVILGGDVLRPELVHRWHEERMRHIPLINAYGPTEAVITATIHHCPQAGEQTTESMPIGRAVGKRMAYILDHWGRPAPVEAWGELCIGGEILARGYLGKSGLTAERFVPDPFSHKEGARLYRTGDIGRRLENGVIEFMGRADHQVKIRGFRLELGEIEAALESHPAVCQAAVVVQEGEKREKKLAAYAVLSDTTTQADALRDHLKEKLPGYMVPAVLRILDAMPLMVSGKIDRKALADLPGESTNTSVDAQFATELQRTLAGMWAEVLGVPQIGLNQDFFEAGGDSIMATALVTKMEKGLGVEVPLRVLFDGPTVRQLAAYLQPESEDDLLVVPQTPDRSPLRRASRDGDLPVAFAQERLWVLSQLRAHASSYNISGGIKIEGDLDVCILELALAELVRRHEPLRTVFQAKEDSVVQVIQQPYSISLDPMDLSILDPATIQARIQALAQEEAERPYNLALGPMLRCRLFRIAEHEHMLWLTIHHIIGDGQSVAILLRELCALYDALSQGLASPLPEPACQFADYACWQREWLTDSELAAHLNYWRGQLRNCPPPALLPQEEHKPHAGSSGENFALSIPGEAPAALRELSARMSATPFMVLLAAWKLLIYAYSGIEDVVVGSHISNRNHPDVQEMIGFFMNVIVLRTDLGGNPDFYSLVNRVRDVSLQAFQHQDIPFERVVDELRPIIDSGQIPFFKTFFAMQNNGFNMPEISGLRTELVVPEDRSAKFDLTLFATESGARINLVFNFKSHRFTPEAIKSIASDYEKLLRKALAHPELHLDELAAGTVDSRSTLHRDMPNMVAGSKRLVGAR